MIHDVIELINWTQVLMWGAGILGSALIVWYRKTIKKWKDGFTDITNGLKTIPTLETSVTNLKKDVDTIRKHVLPNSGSSLSDAVARAEGSIQRVSEQLSLMSETMMAENDADDVVGRFYSDPEGGNTYVNQLYARWMGVGKAELMGWNFLNFIHPEDVDQVRSHWQLCRTENRQYRNIHRMVTAIGDTIRVKVVATPVPENSPILRWVGVMWRLEDE